LRASVGQRRSAPLRPHTPQPAAHTSPGSTPCACPSRTRASPPRRESTSPPPGHHAPIVVHQAVPGSDHGDPLAPAPLPHAVQGWERVRVDGRGWDTPQGRARPRCSNGLGRTPIVLVRLDTWLDALGRHALDRVALRTAPPGPVRRPATGRSPDAPRGPLRPTGHQGLAGQTRAPEHVSRRVSPPTMKHVVGPIACHGVKRWLQGPRRLAVPCGSIALSPWWRSHPIPHRGGAMSLTPEFASHIAYNDPLCSVAVPSKILRSRLEYYDGR
jgi:hypothetical protein